MGCDPRAGLQLGARLACAAAGTTGWGHGTRSPLLRVRARSPAGPPVAAYRLGIGDLAFPACVRNAVWAAGLGRRPETGVRGRVF